jgi:hypothetical protein
MNRKRSFPVPPTSAPAVSSNANPLKILFDNEFGDSIPGVVRSFTLNKYFEFVKCSTIQELSKAAGAQDIVCRTSNFSMFVTTFLFLSVKDLRSIAALHGLPHINRKQNLITALMEHSCELSCDADCLVFKQIIVPRKGPFTNRELPDPVPDTVPTFESMDDLDVLPLMVNNDIVVDVDDACSYISTYKLNRSFDYVGLSPMT